jgi:phage terminase small subunit
MPILKNAKHERFAQGISEGMSGADAYIWAGYASNANAAAVSATRLLKDAKIKARIAELLKRREDIEIKATEKAVNKLAISKERILSELAKIGFADIRKAVKWNGMEIKEEDQPDGGDTLIIKHTYANNVLFMSSDDIDDDTAGAIAEVSQTPTGGLKIKMHDKRAALVDMGKHLGIFKEVHEHTGPGGGPVQLQRIERIIVDPADPDAESVRPAASAKALQRS